MSTLHGDLCTFVIVSCSVALGLSNTSDKCCIENKNTYFVLCIFPENRSLREITWKTMAQPDTLQMTIYRGADKSLAQPGRK
jgi:hypothetical protein